MASEEPASLLEANLKAGLTTESHLESLGFTTINGRPRFHLNEPGLSALGASLSKASPGSIDTSDDAESFVILGKNSLESIRATSMASYNQIQQKSMSIDYNSVISNLSSAEIEQKLSELLQENVRLKETLTQNNLAMKQQFNMLANWQEEVMKVHQSHKQKFAETKDMISQLRKENNELKMKVTENFAEQPASLENIEKSACDAKFQQSLASNVLKCNCAKLTEDVERFASLSNLANQQLKQADRTIEELKAKIKELESIANAREQSASLNDFSVIAVTTAKDIEMQKWIEKSGQQDTEIHCLQEIVASLEQQLAVASSNSFAPIQIHYAEHQNDQPSSQDRAQFIQNVKQYDERLRALANRYAKQSTAYSSVQKILKESADIVQLLETAKLDSTASGEKSTLAKEQVEALASELRQNRVKLIDEQIAIINERQELIKAQNQFQKIFSDYNFLLYELEILNEENMKLSTIQSQSNLSREALERAADIERQMKESQTKLEEEQCLLNMEKLGLSESKRLVDSERGSLDAERRDLEAEREALRQERANFVLQRMTFDRQSNLYDAEKQSLLTKESALQRSNEELLTRIARFEADAKAKEDSLSNLGSELKRFKEEAEKIPLLNAQLEVYRNDFEEERQARQKAMSEKDEVVQQLSELQTRNELLLKELDRTGQSSQSARAPPEETSGGDANADFEVVTAYSCPKCRVSFTLLRPLEEHVERCLDLE